VGKRKGFVLAEKKIQGSQNETCDEENKTRRNRMSTEKGGSPLKKKRG